MVKLQRITETMVHNSEEPASNNNHYNIFEDTLNRYNNSVYQLQTKLNMLEKQLTEVEQFYKSTGSKKSLQHGSKEMQNEVMRHFCKILTEITQHKLAWPFLEPVDVEGLGLYDYHQVIEKPMDFSTIRRKMKAKDGSGYKSVREIYADVRLIFNNAMKYNDEKNFAHVMAKTLLTEFDKKWLRLLPRVAKAESEVSEVSKEEVIYANMARQLSTEISKVEMALTDLKLNVIGQCRKLSLPEKIILTNAFPQLSADNLKKALDIISEDDPNFNPNADVVTFDLETQSDYTLWKLNMFIQQTIDEATTVITHEDNIEEKKNNVKKRRIV